MTLETETGRQEPQAKTNPVAVWKSQIEKLRKASTGTPEQRLNAGLELQIISLGMSVWFQKKDWPTPEYQELKTSLLATLEEFREKEPAKSIQKLFWSTTFRTLFLLSANNTPSGLNS